MISLKVEKLLIIDYALKHRSIKCEQLSCNQKLLIVKKSKLFYTASFQIELLNIFFFFFTSSLVMKHQVPY